MEIVQGKSTDKKIVIAQEIAFAKVLAGNNKTLRDRAIKKLRKWLTVRGNGKWDFTEEEFMRIWTGLFYCMWMSDKFLVQEELAESISSLIHCFKRNSKSALLFIQCFNKRLLMEWEGLDQYRIDKFQMLSRRFLRQTFTYCREKKWDESILKKLMGIFYFVVLHRDNALGFVLHFISMYAEELAKVSKGKLKNEMVLLLFEPFVKLIAKTREDRIRQECEELFNYLLRQTDVGIEFEEQFNTWKKLGYPGTGPHCLKRVELSNGNALLESDDDYDIESDIDESGRPLDPRAGSVHVFLPQIPIDADSMLNCLQKYLNAKETTSKGRKLLRLLCNKFMALKKGRFPQKIKKDPVLQENTKKRRQTIKNAKALLEFTDEIKEGPIRTKEYQELLIELEKNSENENGVETSNEKEDGIESSNESEDMSDIELENDDSDDDIREIEVINKEEEVKTVKNKIGKQCLKRSMKMDTVKPLKKKKIVNTLKENNCSDKSNDNKMENEEVIKKRKKPKKKKKLENGINTEKNNKIEKKKGGSKETGNLKNEINILESGGEITPSKKTGIKRQILSNWQVQELDASSPEYHKIETQKIIRIERKVGHIIDLEENLEPRKDDENVENDWKNEEEETEEIFPVFWKKARAKVNKKGSKNNTMLKNPFAQLNGINKSPGSKKISFALDRNMAQGNEEYLEEVKNSPRVPFDRTKKPSQSALKSGLSPTPINPFYRFKIKKFQNY